MATFRKGHYMRTMKRQRIPPESDLDPITTPLEYTRADNITAIQLLNRDGPNCYLCRRNLPPNYEIEHIIPRSLGGSDHPSNLALACCSCNRHKHASIVSIRLTDRIPCYWIGA